MSNSNDAASSLDAAPRPVPHALTMLAPKGSCWYCNQPLDNVRRFCSKLCADDYLLEEEGFNNPAD